VRLQWLILTVLALALLTEVGAEQSPFQVFKWMPDKDPGLRQAVREFFRLDPAKLPYLEPLPEGGSRLVNPGGAPAATAYTGVLAGLSRKAGPLADTSIVYTLRFDARAPRGAAPASALFLTERRDFTATVTWESHAITAQLPGPGGEGVAAFTLRAREGALDVRNVEIIPLRFSAHAERREGALRVVARGRLAADLQLEVRAGEKVNRSAFGIGAVRVDDPLGPAHARTVPVAAGLVAEWRILDAAGTPMFVGAPVSFAAPPPPVGGLKGFPLGLYTHETSVSAVKAAQSVGLNLVLFAPHPVAGENLEEIVVDARHLGVDVILETGFPTEAADLPAVARELLEPYKNIPFFGWAPIDEPDQKPAFRGILADIRAALKNADGRPIYQANHSPDSFSTLGAQSDILAIDPYPFSAIPRPIYTVAAWMDRARFALPVGHPVWYIQQAFAEAPFWPTPPTPAQMRASTWLALNHGARGVVWYAMHEILNPDSRDQRWTLRDTDLWPEIARETGEIRAAENWLLRPEGPTSLPTRGSLDAALWRDGKRTFVCVVNISGDEAVGWIYFGDHPPRLVACTGSDATPQEIRYGWMQLNLPAHGVGRFESPR